jgi:hypothetical protein
MRIKSIDNPGSTISEEFLTSREDVVSQY